MTTMELSTEEMNLSQLIDHERRRQGILANKPNGLPYEVLADIAAKKGKSITAVYLCRLVNEPLGGLRENTIECVAAAISVDESLVAAAAMRSWGYQLYRSSTANGSAVVLSTRALTAEQTNEVNAHAQRLREMIDTMESNNRTGENVTESAIVPRPKHAVLSDALRD